MSNPAGAGEGAAPVELLMAFSAAKIRLESPHPSAETASPRSARHHPAQPASPSLEAELPSNPSVTFRQPGVAGHTHTPHHRCVGESAPSSFGTIAPGRADLLPRRRLCAGGWLCPTAALNPVKAAWESLSWRWPSDYTPDPLLLQHLEAQRKLSLCKINIDIYFIWILLSFTLFRSKSKRQHLLR